jgi:tRNA pseudouridine38-40 synthase
VAEGFHPRFDALSRRYSYTVIQAAQRQPLLRHRAWRVYQNQALDFEAMQAAAALLMGEHNFATFGQPPAGDVTTRTVYHSSWSQKPRPYGMRLRYRVEANAFLKHMVRRMVGMMVDVGRGAMDISQFEDHLRAADVTLAKTMAPPQGLILEFVRYQE